MEVGILLDMRNPVDWRRPWPAYYGQLIELVREAERRGAGSVWLTEHHHFEDGYLPQPLTLAAAIAARTSRIRIGTGILLGALRHPLHVAEEAALVDVISDGRLELGFGAGWSRAEYVAFGVDFDRRFRHTDDTVSEVERLLRESVRPPAVQRPVPLWLGYQGPRGARRAGRLGVGLLTINRDLVAPYQAGLREGGHDPARARMGGLLDVIVSHDPDRTTDRLLPHIAHQANSYRQGKARSEGRATPALTVDDLRATVRSGGSLPGITVLTPDDAVRAIRARVAGVPVRHVYFWGSVSGMPDDLVEEHLALLLGVVRPALGTAVADRAGAS